MSGIRFPFEDPSLAPKNRAEDLLSRMQLEDKVGLMFQPSAGVGDLDAKAEWAMVSMAEAIERRINHVNVLEAATAREVAEWNNAVQAAVAQQGLGIPVTISTDPRHSFGHNPGASFAAGPFSQWPEPLGIAAAASPALAQRFGEVVRDEYRAVGIRAALHPQIDLATEPRWSRINTTFGEDPRLSAELGVAYVRGLQGEDPTRREVSAVVKHFPGGGPQKDGEDPHFDFGREQVYPGGAFDLHLEPFKAAIAAGAAQMMPYYGMPVGTEYEEVGFGFNKGILTDLLRTRLGFDGIVCSDWGILSYAFWGVEQLSFDERMIKAIDAGVDQLGGETRTDVLIDLVRAGSISVERIDDSARRLLTEKFVLGLFDERMVDVRQVELRVGTDAARTEGALAQAAAITLLEEQDAGIATLPLAHGIKMYVEGADRDAFATYATVVDEPKDADIALLRLTAPWEVRPERGEFAAFFHTGSLEFSREQLEHVSEVRAAAPTIVDVYLDRPAILAPLADLASTMLVNFGATDDVLARVLFGDLEPGGRLPFDIPSSMAAVEASRSDVPFDTTDPTYRFGYAHPSALRPKAAR